MGHGIPRRKVAIDLGVVDWGQESFSEMGTYFPSKPEDSFYFFSPMPSIAQGLLLVLSSSQAGGGHARQLPNLLYSRSSIQVPTVLCGSMTLFTYISHFCTQIWSTCSQHDAILGWIMFSSWLEE